MPLILLVLGVKSETKLLNNKKPGIINLAKILQDFERTSVRSIKSDFSFATVKSNSSNLLDSWSQFV